MSVHAESIAALLADLGVEAELPSALRGRLLSSREVAQVFNVSARTVTAWASDGRLRSVRTPGGHHRFPVQAVRDLLQSVETVEVKSRPATLPRPIDLRWSHATAGAETRQQMESARQR